MKSGNILIVEHDKTLLHVQGDVLKKAGYDVSSAANAEEALASVRENTPDIILTELVLPGMSGIDLIRDAKNIDGAIICIVVTGHGSIDSTVEAMKAGAYTYLTKPLKMNEFLVAVDNAFEAHDFKEGSVAVRRAPHKDFKSQILGNSDKIHDVFALIDAVADTDSTVLILGESGTGKELIAKSIHYQSLRRNSPFVPINCGAIPENLLESELFGHVKGAFTGALSARPGRFEIAKGGTVFLDEIGDMSPNLQVKILRVLQEREFDPVGSIKSKKADVRIIAATHNNLEDAVKEERFREDLYYRLNVIPIYMPPLRERLDDLPILIDHFIKKFNKEKGRNLKGISPEAMKMLTRYSWKGNIRELENLIERLVILKREGIVSSADLPEKIIAADYSNEEYKIDLPPDGLSLKEAVDNFENRLIVQALSTTNWNKNLAAKLLRLKRTTLVEKIKKKGIKEDRP